MRTNMTSGRHSIWNSFSRASIGMGAVSAPAVLSLRPPRLPPVELLEQVGHVPGDDLDDPELERLLRRDARALAHRGLGPVDVAVVLGGDGLDEARPEAFELLRHHVVRL